MDMRHLASVSVILDAIAGLEGQDIGRALVACEDAFVALSLGLPLGLSPIAVARLHHETCDQMANHVQTPARTDDVAPGRTNAPTVIPDC